MGGTLDRRALLGAAMTAAAGGGAVAQEASAPAPAAAAPRASAAEPRQKGPRVWLDMDQQELDDAYDQAKYAPNIAQVVGRYASNSAAARARLGAPLRLAYGATPIEGIDLYPTRQPNAPVQIFIHGGAWRRGLASDYGFLAENFVHAGAHYLAVDFNNVGETNGDLMPMADQVRRAIAWVYRNAESFGGDARRLYLSGHSSGAHLAGVALVTPWQDYGVPDDIIKGALCCSGMYDLKAPRLSARSNYVQFTDAMEDALSTQRHLARINCPVVVAYGTNETPEFQRQNREFAAALKAAGKPVELLVGEGYNHFEMCETLANPYGLTGRAALAQMHLAPA
ncbi:MAG TPA: alpha/beta hydrolase [Xanthobacteraceae bacterium]|nr:alpha/beta hydrolase [Xanthobacteraceae bacterium]